MKAMLLRLLPLSFISLNTNVSDVLDQIDRKPLILIPSTGSSPTQVSCWQIISRKLVDQNSYDEERRSFVESAKTKRRGMI